jgi:hypothetical protein
VLHGIESFLHHSRGVFWRTYGLSPTGLHSLHALECRTINGALDILVAYTCLGMQYEKENRACLCHEAAFCMLHLLRPVASVIILRTVDDATLCVDMADCN